jgi:acyl-coenzyme A synthetase/AMP-(fatty) acid ligase
MEHADWQIERSLGAGDKPAVAWRDSSVSHAELASRTSGWIDRLREAGVQPGFSVAVAGDYSPGSIACLLALIKLKCVLVPLSRESSAQHAEFREIAELDALVEIDQDDRGRVSPQPFRRAHPLLERLRSDGDPGLILFSSGSSGQPKAILHSLPRLLEKFRYPGHGYRSVAVLLFDHVGGFNTLMYTLANLGCLVAPGDRSVTEVCRAIEKHKADLLPTSPSFLNLLLLAGAHEQFDLSSLKLITYGTEVMPERTLEALNRVFPGVRLHQTYGLSELGILRSKSASNQSLLVKVGGEDYETKVVDGTLRVRAKCSMVGYLNAPSPFDEDGWFNTGDEVIQDGEYYRILGRQSDVINVGGLKVHPTEVEKVIGDLPGIADVSVSGEQNLLLGQIVVATVQMHVPVSPVELRRRIAEHCRGRLQPFMIPTKVKVVSEPLVNHRFKKVRR